jgi:hypothetical protein
MGTLQDKPYQPGFLEPERSCAYVRLIVVDPDDVKHAVANVRLDPVVSR